MTSYQKLNLSEIFSDHTNPFAYIIDGVLSASECMELIQRSESTGYKKALVGKSQEYDDSYRNNSRLMIDDNELSKFLFSRVKAYLPDKWNGYSINGLNERLCFLKYKTGERFGFDSNEWSKIYYTN